MVDTFQKLMRTAGRSVDRFIYWMTLCLFFGTGHKWLDRILGVVFLVISIALAVIIFGEIGRETGLWIPSWDRLKMDPGMPGWASLIRYGSLLYVSSIRCYFFFKPMNGYKER